MMTTTAEQAKIGDNFVLLRSGSDSGRRIGIHARGSCDARLILATAPLIRHVLKGECCILYDGIVSDSRSDLLLQTLQDLPQERLGPVIKNLRLDPNYFRNQLFHKTFAVPAEDGPEEFPKTVVVLSTGADVIRTVYRHREHGLLVDPGGVWLSSSLEPILDDPSAVRWFRENFVSVGRIPVEAFVENFTRIIHLLRSQAGAHILVFNTLTVDPGGTVHNYQFVRNPHALRRREFHVALAELSRQLDFPVIDVDHVLKRAGVRHQVDFGHPPEAYSPVLAQEAFRIMCELGIF